MIKKGYWTGKKRSAEDIEKFRISHLGKKFSEKTREKMSFAHRDENAYNFKGNNVGYRALHNWVRIRMGISKECAYCGSNEGKIEWASISHKAKRDINDYIPLCIKCHRKYDSKWRRNFERNRLY